MTPLKPIMTAAEVAELLQCSPRTVQDHARAGVLPAKQFGDCWIFPTAALLEAVNTLAKTEAQRRAMPVKPAAMQKRVRPDLSVIGG